jgi:exoribonuclease II
VYCGTPLDKLVSELMIHVNAAWGKELAERSIAAIYRVQGNGKVMLSVEPAPHEGLGVPQYTWASSPLRRYVDLINQRQIISWLTAAPPPYTKSTEELASAMRDFEIAYDAYAEFQRNMERYWCLRYLLQEEIKETNASVLRESLVRLAGVPLVCRVPSLPSLAFGTEVRIEIGAVDLWELNVQCQFKGKVKSP